MEQPEQNLTKKQIKELKKLEKQKKQALEKKKEIRTYLFLGFIIIIIIGLFILGLYFSKERITDVKADLDPFKGAENALVEISEYSDFTCPACKAATVMLDLALDEYKDKVKVVYNDFANPRHNNSAESAIAAQCAWNQDKFWEFHDKLFEKQEEWMVVDEINKTMTEYAGTLELDEAEFESCLGNEAIKSRVDRDFREALKLKVNSTPTFFVNDEMIVGVQTLDGWKKIIEDKLSEVE